MKKSYPFLLISKFLIAASITSLLLAGCSSTNKSETEQQASPAPKKIKLNSVAKKTIRDAVLAYLAFECKPKYTVNGMEVYAERAVNEYELADVDETIFIKPDTDNFYGNFATRTLFLNSLFHYNLSGVHYSIFDIYDTEMKSFREGYSNYKKIADKSAKNLCKLVLANLYNDTLTTADQQKVQVVFDELVANWPSFIEWYSATRQVATDISDENDAFVKDLMTPKCSEFPSSDGKYVVVKCSVPPG